MSRLPRFLRHPAPLVVLASVILATSACSGSNSSTGASAAGASGGSSSKSSGAPPAAETRAAENPVAVSAGYTGYSQALASKSGSAVADQVSQSSLAYISRLRDLAVGADRKTLAQENPVDQVTVLTMRAKLDPAMLRKATPQQLVEAAVQDGLIGLPSRQGLTDIKVSGKVATAQVLLPGTKTHYPVWLHLEQGKWKYDLSSLLGPAESELTAARAHVKNTNDQEVLVMSALDTAFGKAEVTKLYKPLGN